MGWNKNDLPENIRKQIDAKDAGRIDRVKAGKVEQVIKVDKLPPGLNGDDGLINLHWTDYRDLKRKWVQYIFAQQPQRHAGKVSINYTRVSTRPMDWDNLGASFKVIGDALEANDVIINDSPEIVNPFTIDWQKADTMREQGVIIEIKDVE